MGGQDAWVELDSEDEGAEQQKLTIDDTPPVTSTDTKETWGSISKYIYIYLHFFDTTTILSNFRKS